MKWDNLVNITMFKCKMQVLVKDMKVRVTMITVGGKEKGGKKMLIFICISKIQLESSEGFYQWVDVDV